MGTKHLTPDRIQELLESYSRTLDVVLTAREVGASREQVRHWLKRHGIRPGGGKGGRCYQRIDQLRAWAAQGVSLAEMARRIGASRNNVTAFLSRHNIPRTPSRQTGANNPAWNGGRMIDGDGYVLVRRPDHPAATRHGYVLEHRLVMEAVLGRHLLPAEVVHHRDGNKQNNQPDNLELFESNGRHLAATLAGKRPRWSASGLQRIREGCRRKPARQRATTPTASTPGGRPSPETNSRTPSSPDTAPPPPCETGPSPGPGRAGSSPTGGDGTGTTRRSSATGP